MSAVMRATERVTMTMIQRRIPLMDRGAVVGMETRKRRSGKRHVFGRIS
jgi:hypothetical protein